MTVPVRPLNEARQASVPGLSDTLRGKGERITQLARKNGAIAERLATTARWQTSGKPNPYASFMEAPRQA